MQGTGKTYEVSGETTEWDDILIKKGITTKEEVLFSKGLNPLDVSLTSELLSVRTVSLVIITLDILHPQFMDLDEPEEEEPPKDKYEDLDLDELDALDEVALWIVVGGFIVLIRGFMYCVVG
jgi:hypothetical protein